MAFRWRADDGLLIVAFESSLPSSTKKKQNKNPQSWTRTPLLEFTGSARVTILKGVLLQIESIVDQKPLER